MKNITFTIILFLTIIISIDAQTVETLVAGPSTFNDGLALDKAGNIYAADYFGSTITKITPEGNDAVFASGFNYPNGLAFGPDGLLYVPSPNGDKIDVVTLNGDVTLYKSIESPSALTFDKHGNMIVAHYPTNQISKIDTAGNVTSYILDANLNGPIGVLFDDNDNFYYGNFTDGKIFKKTPLGATTQFADIPGWMGFMTIAGNSMYATAYQRHQIYKIPLDGSGQLIYAGSGRQGQVDGPIANARFTQPNGIIASPTGDTLYISEYGTRSLRMIIGVNTTTSVNDENEIVGFKLNQNYPNPFNPSTTIQYSISESQLVSLKVYDLLGQEVSTIIEESQNMGSYSYNFNATDLSSGIYIYQLKAGSLVESKKMTLLK